MISSYIMMRSSGGKLRKGKNVLRSSIGLNVAQSTSVAAFGAMMVVYESLGEVAGITRGSTGRDSRDY